MQIRFADHRPEGDYALVLPVAGKDRKALASLGAEQQAVAAALDRNRFEGEAAGASEHFFDDGGTVRRLLVVGTGTSSPAEAAEKLGGTAASKLLTSGETQAVIDLTGLGYRRRGGRARRARRGASLVALRPLSHHAQGQAEGDPDRSGRGRRGRRRRAALHASGGRRSSKASS